MTTKLLSFIFLHLCICCSATNAVSIEQECAALKEKCYSTTVNANHRGTILFSEQLLSKAREADNLYFQGYALYYLGMSNVFIGNNDNGKKQLDESWALSEKIGNDTLKLSILNAYGVYEANAHNNLALAQQFFFKGLEYAVKIKDRYRQSLIECNLCEIAALRNDTTGIKYALNCYQWADSEDNTQMKITGAYHCANLYNIKGDYNNALKYIRIADETSQNGQYAERCAILRLQSEIYIALGEQDKALDMINNAMREVGNAQGMSLAEVYLTYARVLSSIGRINESNDMINRAVSVSDSLAIAPCRAPLYLLLSENYEKKGLIRDALDAYKRYKQECDSIFIREEIQSINELKVQYDIDRREREADLDRLMLDNERKKNALLIISVFSLVAISAGLYVYSLRRRKLYRKIVQQHRDAIAREQDLLGRLDAAQTTAKQASVSDSKASALYNRLCRMMEEEKIFTDCDLTRDSLAERLETNRTYLTQIINDKTGKTFTQFINEYRIKEAIKILTDNSDKNYPLKALCSDVGFSSMTTFYKVFQNAVGMTPTVFKNATKGLQ